MELNQNTSVKKISLDDYGNFLSVYRGKGSISIIDGAGEKIHQCSFEVGQRNDGDIILICRNIPAGFSIFFHFGMQAKKFHGETDEGYSIKSNESEKFLQLRYLKPPENWLYDDNLVFRITELSLKYSEEPLQEIHFGLCNFQFDEEDVIENETESDNIILPLTEQEKIEIQFKKIRDYNETINRISILGTIDVTCELILKITDCKNLEKIVEIVDDICFLLSIKKGTKVSWIYYDICDNTGKTIFKKHGSKVTKIFQPLDIFYFKDPHGFQTKKFLELTYPHYIKNRDRLKLNRGVIDTYLDAKTENDFIETRAGKLALTIEFLKNEFLVSKGKESEYVLPSNDFKNMTPAISAAMIKAINLQCVIDPKIIRLIVSEKKVEGLNRRSFGNILKEIIKEFDAHVSSKEITLFIRCRNSLVHRGNFYCKTCQPEDIRECEPLPSYMFEYFFMINILDRIFLSILGLDDNQIRIDWRNPSEKMIEWLRD